VATKPQSPAGTTPGTELNQDSSSSSKGRPTPSRKEKEAARKRPLVANDRSERKRQEREAAAVAREKQRVGMAAGDERYLPVRDRGPQRRYVRDFVDARWSVGEVLLPMIGLFFVTSFAFSTLIDVQIITTGVMWFVLLVAGVDIIILGFQLKKRLAQKFGEDKVEKGYRLYAAMRAIYLRPMRLPKPQVKRGANPS
jgi:hypothetical protein